MRRTEWSAALFDTFFAGTLSNEGLDVTSRFGSMSPRQRDFARARAFPASGGVAQVARATVTIDRYFLLLIAFCFAFFAPIFDGNCFRGWLGAVANVQ
jgi:hypothetical protein